MEGSLTLLVLIMIMLAEEMRCTQYFDYDEQPVMPKEVELNPAQKYLVDNAESVFRGAHSQVTCKHDGVKQNDDNSCKCKIDYPTGYCDVGRVACRKMKKQNEGFIKCKCPPGVKGTLCLSHQEVCQESKAVELQKKCKDEYIDLVTHHLNCPRAKMADYLKHQLDVCLEVARYEAECIGEHKSIKDSEAKVRENVETAIKGTCVTTNCLNGGTLDEETKECKCPNGFEGKGCSHRVNNTDCCRCPNPPMDCYDFYERGYRTDGVFIICVGDQKKKVKVYCDMASGGWTVIQRRSPHEEPRDLFKKSWQQYNDGFGNPFKNYWMGNKYIHFLTNTRNYILQVTLTSLDEEIGVRKFLYTNFRIEGENTQYKLHYGCYTGLPGENGFEEQVNRPFSTYDRDSTNDHCPLKSRGGWWFHSCCISNLNGIRYNYTEEISKDYEPCDGIMWAGKLEHKYSYTEMAIKAFNITD